MLRKRERYRYVSMILAGFEPEISVGLYSLFEACVMKERDQLSTPRGEGA
jgi:hypothetical protein